MVMDFHNLVIGALAAGSFGITCSPGDANFSLRVVAEGDAWAHFRILKLKFRLVASDVITAALAAGYVGGIQDSPPITQLTVMELIPATVRGVQQTCYSDWVVVPKKDLAGPFPWYKTIPGAADSTEEAPGQIRLAGSTTSAFTLEIRGTIEFKTGVATANTPLAANLSRQIREERHLTAVLAEKERLMRIISAPPAVLSAKNAPVLPSARP